MHIICENNTYLQNTVPLEKVSEGRERNFQILQWYDLNQSINNYYEVLFIKVLEWLWDSRHVIMVTLVAVIRKWEERYSEKN